jgi:hypothetical protein
MAEEQKAGVQGHEAGAKAQPSGSKGDSPATAGKGETKVTSGAAEEAEGELNPSAPGNTGTTPGTVPKLG